jgi:hypothetical protein
MTRKIRRRPKQAASKRRRRRRLVEHRTGLLLEVAETPKPARKRRTQPMLAELVTEAAEAMTRRQLRHLRRRSRSPRPKTRTTKIPD